MSFNMESTQNATPGSVPVGKLGGVRKGVEAGQNAAKR